jgi:Spy/CpxP family protein refolding chaperone
MNAKYKIIIVVSLAAVFAIGAGAGFFAGKTYSRSEKCAAKERRRHQPPTVEMLARDLSLNQTQQAALRDLFQKSEERFKLFDTEYHKQLNELRLLLKNDIDAVLTPEQKIKLEAMIREHIQKTKKIKDARNSDGRPQEKDKGETP